jgi:hypothetical protein
MELHSNKCPVCKTEYGTHNIQEAVNKEYNRLIEENIKLKTELEKHNYKIQELEEKLRAYENVEDSEGKYSNLADDFEIQELIDKLKHPLVVEFIRNIINEDYQQLNNYINPENQYDSTSHKTEENTTNDNLEDTIIHDNNLENNSQEHGYIDSSIDLTLDEQELVNNYKNPNSDFHECIIKVSEPEESQTNRWSGSKEATIFKHDLKGNYWIVNMNDSLYIVPQRKFKINEYSQYTLFSTFDCRSYQSGESENFVLIKPGKVTAINRDGWQLIEPGILQF